MNTAKKEYMEDGRGHLVPINKVKDIDKLEDQLVIDLVRQAETLQQSIKGFKSHSYDDIQSFLDIIAEKYNVKRGGKKGNITLTSYNGKLKIVISIAEFIQFGAQLEIAKQLIDECIHAWNENSDDNIAALINNAFRTDSKNRVNTQTVLGLRKLNIQDEKW